MVKSDKGRRIGVFGGTFNPVHHGHLINALQIREKFSLDFILFIPDRIPVHKTINEPVEPGDRLLMVKLAVANSPFFQVSDIELERETPSYTITTLYELREMYSGDELFLIIGSDSFNELDTWKEYKKIIAEFPVIVMKRLGSGELRNDILSISRHVDLFDESVIDISSTRIRERVRAGLPVNFFTTDDVARFINEKELYKIEK